MNGCSRRRKRAWQIASPGGLEGPLDAGRELDLQLAKDLDRIMRAALPVLNRVFRDWLGRSLNADVWEDVTLAGVGVEDPSSAPVEWDVSFETKGPTWLGITIPCMGDQPQDPAVDTET